MNIVGKTAKKDNFIFSPYLSTNDNNTIDLNENKENINTNNFNNIKKGNFTSNGRKELSNSDKEFLSKKRKMPKIYQSVINQNDSNIQTPNKEKNNILNQEFSNFEI